jgi:SAM-dependent methyltransferase
MNDARLSPAPNAQGPAVATAIESERFAKGSRSLLTHRDLGRFPSESLFDKVGRVVCGAGCLPRKELFEAWEVTRRVRRRVRGGRVVDLACGHGLAAHLLLLLDASSKEAWAVDSRLPESAPRLAAALAEAWPNLRDRVVLREGSIETTTPLLGLGVGDLVVSVHACGALTDRVLAGAIAASASVAVLPCCHDASVSDIGGLGGWLDDALAIDATRAARLRGHGYEVHTQTIPASITPKNRLLLGIYKSRTEAGTR